MPGMATTPVTTEVSERGAARSDRARVRSVRGARLGWTGRGSGQSEGCGSAGPGAGQVSQRSASRWDRARVRSVRGVRLGRTGRGGPVLLPPALLGCLTEADESYPDILHPSVGCVTWLVGSWTVDQLDIFVASYEVYGLCRQVCVSLYGFCRQVCVSLCGLCRQVCVSLWGLCR